MTDVTSGSPILGLDLLGGVGFRAALAGAGLSGPNLGLSNLGLPNLVCGEGLVGGFGVSGPGEQVAAEGGHHEARDDDHQGGEE